MLAANTTKPHAIAGDFLRVLAALLKFRLSFLVAFSSAFGYLLAISGPIVWEQLIMLSLGGFLVSGAATSINQVLERKYDRLMDRTKTRPLPSGRITVQDALVIAAVTGTLGLGLLLLSTNVLTTALSALSLVLYSFVYTPMKRVGPLAVLVGAIPGALPPLLGWTAATGAISAEAMILFGIQFVWQFPHFWAIAWVADADYKKAGFKLLPLGGEKDLRTAIRIMSYTLFLLPLGLLPTKLGITGINSALVATICGVLFLIQTFHLMRDCNQKAALRLMFGSFIYLPVVHCLFIG
ncbi:Protoheme IX farnesyltransferase [Cesiribacter andamanensis AMV16]|uniref:Protoheme IX farnesyltransferase n=1 Tax=Cesiribacter andamanensis AMV16 TaxID=1279009 RepID=M7N718_9BACT|nr:heme o synthase [Cesiribacter andamanensis]EMR03031.1 Protoheme IX farnesyltransferase [Cesiribacter andamanensis AMV16]